MIRGGALRAAQVTSLIVVDDDPAVLRMTKRSLERRGYRVVAASSGDDALRCLAHETFDCMISDVQMAGMNGLRLLRAVRDRDLDLPVVLVTGNPDVETAATAVEYGAFHYLIKPVAGDQLEATIERAANAGRMARARREYVEQYSSGVFLTGDRAGVDATLDRALRSLWMAFQPIVHAKGESVFAQEALLRTEEAVFAHPGAVLEAAERAQRLYDVGRAVRASVADSIAASPDHWIFFVNLHPEDLRDTALHLAEAPLSQVADRVVLELTERMSLETMPGIRNQITHLREMGFRIALDDLGAGYAGLTSFVRLEPEFVKLDTSLVRDIHQSDGKQKIVGSMVSLCHEMGKQIIAEGVEHAAERDTLVALGCDLLQGYLFGRPDKLT